MHHLSQKMIFSQYFKRAINLKRPKEEDRKIIIFFLNVSQEEKKKPKEMADDENQEALWVVVAFLLFIFFVAIIIIVILVYNEYKGSKNKYRPYIPTEHTIVVEEEEKPLTSKERKEFARELRRGSTSGGDKIVHLSY